jgi:lipopolysaccharide/colanic/teichoic acid biosynthesis glycosyltransferase
MLKNKRSIIFIVTSSISLGFLNGKIRQLGQRGWQTTVASSPTIPGQLEQFARREESNFTPVAMEREISPLADVKSLYRTYQVIRRIRPLILNVGTPKAGLVGGLAGVLARVPIRVYTLHGLRLETTTGVKRRLLNMAEQLAMAASHRIVCVSPSLRQNVMDLKLASAHKVVVLGAGSVNGIPLDKTVDQNVVAELRRKYDLAAGQPVVGFVGRMVRDKGIIELLTAFDSLQSRHADAKLLLIGDYETGDPVSTQVHERIKRTPGIVHVGFVPDVMPYYAMMTVLALPTYREGLGLVVLEAAAQGVPSVTTDATGARDTVLPGRTGWRVPVGESSALAEALLEAVSQPAATEKYGLAAQAWVREQFAQDAVQERWMNYYDELSEWHRLSLQHPSKRIIDGIIAAAGLLALAAPLAVLAVIVRLKLGNPVLFAQIRPGLAGQPFTMYKFRTMTDHRDDTGQLLPDAQRLTPFGRWLRATSLDELPELVNVLKGDMSLVGPRPLLTRYTPFFSVEERQRLDVRPGITGWAQVNGRNTVSWDDRLALDVWYVKNMSPRLDLRILWLTLIKIFHRSGVVVDPESIMQNLDDERRGSVGL